MPVFAMFSLFEGYSTSWIKALNSELVILKTNKSVSVCVQIGEGRS
jgi:hypothetical protein